MKHFYLTKKIPSLHILVSNGYSLEFNRIDKLAMVRMPPMEPLEAANS